MLLAIDPGVHSCGYAVDLDGVLTVGHESTDYVLGLAERLRPRDCFTIVELPQVYSAAKSKGDPEDLIQLARVVGRIEQATYVHGREPCRIVRPNEWKGSISKAMHNARIIKCAAESLPTVYLAQARHQIAQLPASRAHNAIDALGLWLFGSGRMSRRGQTLDPLRS